MKTQFRPTREVLAEVERLLASATPAPGKPSPLEEVVGSLYQGRKYFWIGIYLVAGRRVVRHVFRGPVPPCHSFEFGQGNVGTAGQSGVLKVIPDVSQDATYSMCFVETKSEIVVPIKIVGRVLGVVDVESDRLSAFGPEERVLLEKVAERLARYLTSRGKVLLRKAREASREKPSGESSHPRGRQPGSEKLPPARNRAAAAGEA